MGDDSERLGDQWCVQLGLANELFVVDMEIIPGSEELQVNGTIYLREGFCEEKPQATTDGGVDMNRVMDMAQMDLSIPVGAAAEITYNLQGQRSLFGVEGLLDSDTGAIVELRFTNNRPD